MDSRHSELLESGVFSPQRSAEKVRRTLRKMLSSMSLWLNSQRSLRLNHEQYAIYLPGKFICSLIG